MDDNRDPADRIITAFAIKHELSIVTSDKKIKTLSQSNMVKIFDDGHSGPQ